MTKNSADTSEDTTANSNIRLDLWLVGKFAGLTRSAAAKLIEKGKVKVSGHVQSKAGYKVRPSDDVAVDYIHEQSLPVKDVELPVIYEDDNVVVIDKPMGLLTHSKGSFNPEPTVASWLSSKLNGDFGDNINRAGIVHRLDRATSGVMICAKNPGALKHLQKQFSARKTKKTYAAVISGHLPHDHAVIDVPIERNPKFPQTFRAGVNGKQAITEYQTTESDNKHTLLQLTPKTGRTHQLRVHLHYLGHPIVGDKLYGGEPHERLMLHAVSLEITLPGGERKVFASPMPDEFKAIIES